MGGAKTFVLCFTLVQLIKANYDIQRGRSGSFHVCYDFLFFFKEGITVLLISCPLLPISTTPLFIEWFSIECRKTNTRVNTSTNHSKCKQRNEPIQILSNDM